MMQAEPLISDALRIRAEAEYREMPELKLTAAQAARLWHLGPAQSAQLLDSLVDAGLLYRTRDGSYLLLWDSR
jgi:DNA-binding IclR family transcriptional regulator